MVSSSMLHLPLLFSSFYTLPPSHPSYCFQETIGKGVNIIIHASKILSPVALFSLIVRGTPPDAYGSTAHMPSHTLTVLLSHALASPHSSHSHMPTPTLTAHALTYLTCHHNWCSSQHRPHLLCQPCRFSVADPLQHCLSILTLLGLCDECEGASKDWSGHPGASRAVLAYLGMECRT
eukprot:1043197-Pelagomonas_calceolata.AAC.2